MLFIRNMSYRHPDQTLLFNSIHLTVDPHQKIGMTGNNGAGKSTLLKLISGLLPYTEGEIIFKEKLYYLPQLSEAANELSVADVLGINKKLRAMQEILNGIVTDRNMQELDNDWAIEERAHEAMKGWNLNNIRFNQPLSTLSGGQKTKLFLAGIQLADPQLILLDEPGNHLDMEGKELLANFIVRSAAAIILVSHDRSLLNLADTTIELRGKSLISYGGNYDFYREQKQLELDALEDEIHHAGKSLRKAKEKERETIARQQKLDAGGKQKKKKEGVARIMMKTLKNSAEKTTSRLKEIHEGKSRELETALQQLRNQLPDSDKMKLNLDNSNLHTGKILFSASGLNHSYKDNKLWTNDISLEIRSHDRITLSGPNGSGKTTLLNIIAGKLKPASGNICSVITNTVFMDQDYSIINNKLTVYEQASAFNPGELYEHEIKIRLARFLFMREEWNKSCASLSGGEKMRLLLCCLTIGNKAPDLVILDEPTNNLDMQNIAILTEAIRQYNGTLLVVSHDNYFLDQINITTRLTLK